MTAASVPASQAEPACPAARLRADGHEFTQPPDAPTLRGRVAHRSARAYLSGGAPEIPGDPGTVVVVTGGNLGGAVLSLPLVTAVRKRFPRTHLAVVSNTTVGREFMEFAGVGDSFWTMPADPIRSPLRLLNYLSTLTRLAARRPQLLVSNHDGHIDGHLLPLRVPVRVGHTGASPPGHPLRWGSTFNIPVPVTRDMNWLETYRLLAERLDAPFSGPPSVTVPEPLRQWADNRLAEMGLGGEEACVAVQIGVWEQQAWKQWPVRHLADLCSALWAERGLRPVLLGDSTGARATEELRQLASDLPAISLVGSTGIAQAAAIMDRCRVSVCNDSGLMHLSAAVGTPTVAVYGMTNPAKTWCYGSPHRFVRREDCLPCYDLDTRVLARCEHRMCLTQLDPDRVLRAVLDILEAG